MVTGATALFTSLLAGPLLAQQALPPPPPPATAAPPGAVAPPPFSSPPGYGQPPPGYYPQQPYPQQPPPGYYPPPMSAAELPPSDEPKTNHKKRPLRSPGLVVVGSLFLAGGVVGVVASMALFQRNTTEGYGVFIGGWALIGAGIPMIVIGAKRVPPKYDPLAFLRSPTVMIGPRGGAVTFQF